MRIQKFLADSGVASRRASEKLVEQGLVEVNGAKAVVGQNVDPQQDKVYVNGKQVFPFDNKVYIMFYKPTGVVSASADDRGRKTVIDLIKNDIKCRVFCVGRLDYNTEGLLLLTNDGEFSNKVAHPRNKIEKTYMARVKGGLITKEDIFKLRNGVMLDDGKTAPAKVYIEDVYPDNTTLLKIVIREGKNRQVRRMCEAVNHPVIDLKRTEVGGLTLGNLPYGKWRYLSQTEVSKIMNSN